MDGPPMLKRFYDRVLALAGHRQAPWFLVAVAFAEASVFPIPPDALLGAMGLARPGRVQISA
jgi:membrane protein YqaA with SNARE-associated domain